VVLTLAGDVDTDTVDATLADLLRQLEGEPLDDFAPVEIDCSGLTYLGSAGMSMLVRFRSRSGRDVVLLGLADAFRRIFVVSGLDHMFVIR
jgi:anti-anti-sigma factor